MNASCRVGNNKGFQKPVFKVMGERKSTLNKYVFTYRNLNEWLHNPLGTPPTVPQPEQLRFQLQGFG